MSDAVDFPKKARSIVSEQFGNRFVDMERTIRANLLLDGALSVIGKQKESKFLVLKGGSALQRAYRSPRFSDDLDFCLAKKNEKLSRESFIEFGQAFKEQFVNNIHNIYDIKSLNVSVELPMEISSLSRTEMVDMMLNAGFFGSKMFVTHFYIHAEVYIQIPERKRIRLIGTEYRARESKPEIQTVKIDICNLPANSYSALEVLPVNDSSFSEIPVVNVATVDDIHCEKLLSGLSRAELPKRPGKFSDFFDQYYAEFLMGGDIPVLNEDVFMEKLHMQFRDKAKGSDINAAIREVAKIYSKNRNIFFNEKGMFRMTNAFTFFSNAGSKLEQGTRMRFFRNPKAQQLFFKFAGGRYRILEKMLAGESWFTIADSLVSAKDIKRATDSDDGDNAKDKDDFSADLQKSPLL